MMLPEVGEVGQAKLLQSKVLCLGAGGLGSPAGLYLAAAGVGTLGLRRRRRGRRVQPAAADPARDRPRGHAQGRVGAKIAIGKLNPDVKVIALPDAARRRRTCSTSSRTTTSSSTARDNFPTRYLLNDAALKLGKPVIHGSIYRFEGQVTTFMPSSRGPCYRCLYPEPPPPDMAPSCQEAGVLGVLPGVIGVLQATEAIKLLLGTGKTLSGRGCTSMRWA